MADLGRVKRNIKKMLDGGASEEEVDRYIASENTTIEAIRSAPLDGQSAPQPERQDINPVADAAFQLAGPGFNKGLYDFASLPANLLNAVIEGSNTVSQGITGDPTAGTDFRFKGPLAAIPELEQFFVEGDPRLQPTTSAGRVAKRVGEYVGADAIPTMLTIGAAPTVKAITETAKQGIPRLANIAATGVTRAPGAVAAGEITSSVTAGLGGEIGQAIGGDTGELIGALAGGIAGPEILARTPANLARKGVVRLKDHFNPEKVAARADTQTRRLVKEAIEEGGDAAIRETAQLQRDIPGYKPSVAEATESPDFIATQRAFEQSSSGADLNRAKRRYELNEEAVRQAALDQAPDSPRSLDDALIDRRTPAAIEIIDDADLVAARSQSELADDLQSGRSRGELGAEMRQELSNVRTDMKEQLRITAEDMGLNDPAARFNWKVEKQSIIDSVTPRSKLADKSALPTSIVTDIERMGDDVSIVDLMELRSRISSDIREARRTPTGEKRVPYLARMQEAVDDATTRIISQSDDPDLADRLIEYRKIYFDDLIEPFEKGAAGRLLSKDISGDYKVSDEKVAKQYFDTWSESSAKQFNQTFKNSPAASKAMEAAAFDSLFEASVRDGIIQPNLMEAWVRRHADTIGQFPELRVKIDQIEGVNQQLAQRRATLNARKIKAERSVLARELAKVSDGLAAPEKVLDDALKSPARMAKIVMGIRDADSTKAIARHFWDSALSAQSPMGYLNRYEKSLRISMGDEFYNRAKRLARAVEKNQLVPRPSGRPIDANPTAQLESVLGTGLNQISSRVFAVKSGRTSARYAVADIVGRAFRQMTGDAARKALQEALYDPRIAKDFEDVLRFKNLTPAAAKRLHTHLIGTGAIALNKEAVEDDTN